MSSRVEDPYRIRRNASLAFLLIVLLVVAVASISLGAVDLTMGEALDVVLSRFGLGTASDGAVDSVVWGLRVPRLLTGLAVGAALAAAGVALQGMLRNDLADPQLLGIGPGAAIGAALGAGAGGVPGAISGGVAAGVATALLVRRLSRAPTADPNRLILAGVALGATLSAFVGFVVFGSDRAVVPPIEFWLLGSLSGSTWRALGTVVVFLLVGVGGLWGMGRLVDLLGLGAQEASHVGVDVPLVTTVLLVLVGLSVGATVGVVGVVVFVGLLIPRLLRPLTGPLTRHLLSGCLLAGAVFVAASDLVARLVLEPIEIPVGLVTAVVGGPVFLWMVTRRRSA